MRGQVVERIDLQHHVEVVIGAHFFIHFHVHSEDGTVALGRDPNNVCLIARVVGRRHVLHAGFGPAHGPSHVIRDQRNDDVFRV